MHSLLDPELDQLRDYVLLMGGEVEMAIDRAMRSLVERDSELAVDVLASDDRIDAMELEVDRTCIRVLALKSPEARDLRFVITAVKLTPILERIADHACNIARAALDLNREPQLRSYVDLPRMSHLAREMLRDALDAFATADAAAARGVLARDDEIDRLYDLIFHDLMDYMSRDAAAASRAARLLLVAKHLERIGDYVTDICEQIVYMKEALVIRHSQLVK
ncbi:MAG: phosphate signaling complex protein PhoU [Blastocatellia bacterium]